MSATIRCRAKIVEGCHDGRDDSEIYEDGWTDDGTHDGDSVVCDACYPLVEPFCNDRDRPLMLEALGHEAPRWRDAPRSRLRIAVARLATR